MAPCLMQKLKAWYKGFSRKETSMDSSVVEKRDELTGSWIQTYNGSRFDFLNPEASEFTIEDIAHALSNICRFTGHVREFYSVAQHCVMASHIVPPEDALAALLHDAPEAFLGDVSSPLKKLLPDYKAIERDVEVAVLRRFGLAVHLPPSVKVADLVMLATEKRDLMRPAPQLADGWRMLVGVSPLPKTLQPWDPEKAEWRYIKRYKELKEDADERWKRSCVSAVC